MGFSVFVFTFLIFFFFFFSSNSNWARGNSELGALMDIKVSLDPESLYLSSWAINGDPCAGTFDGVACNEKGHVANISLQGKGLSGKLSPAISELKHLTGLYLHYNAISGEIPREISNLTDLSDLYLNVNNISGEIPPEIGSMDNLQVLQLCYNQLIGSIPTQLGSLKNLAVLALQSNQLTGAIPASLGDLQTLTRVDLGFNHLFGSIPSKLADAPILQVLDIRNNTLSGTVPLALKKLNSGFTYSNNLDLCGSGFESLKPCNASSNRPEPFAASGTTRNIPETANVNLPCSGTTSCTNNSSSSRSHRASVIVGTIAVTLALAAIAAFSFTQYRRRKQSLAGTSFAVTGESGNKAGCKKTGSPLISLEYSNGWDPLGSTAATTTESFHKFRFNLDEIESATHYFSEVNLLGKSSFSATFRGILRDGSSVAVKSIGKSCCKSEESEFLKGLNVLTSLRHENLVRLRGFCCSRGRGECFLVYDFVSNGNLLAYLDLKDGDSRVLEWSTRVSIIRGTAKGVAYLHSHMPNKPSLVHQKISAEKVLINQRLNPMLSDSGLQNLLTNDVVFSALKSTAAMGYLAPEYTTTGRFTDKSDVFAFGVLVLQILSGKRQVASPARSGGAHQSARFGELIDPNLHGRFFEYEAAKLANVALLCTHECPIERPSMDSVLQELSSFTSCL